MMYRLPRSGLVILVVGLFSASPLRAVAPSEFCCACLVSTPQALFCAVAIGSNEALADQCADLTADRGHLQCFAVAFAMSEPQDDVDCTAFLEGESITCPGTAPAPLLGGLSLAGLAAIIGGLGVLAVRRRGRAAA